MRQWVKLGTVLLVVLTLSGCASVLADKILSPGSVRVPADEETRLKVLLGAHELTVTNDELFDVSCWWVPAQSFDIDMHVRLLEADDAVREVFVDFDVAQATDRQPAKPAIGTVVIAHGLTLNKTSLYPWIALLADAGFDVMALDLPAHGDSEGAYVTYGIDEALAINAATYWFDPELPILGLGISLGATSMVRAAAEWDGFDAVVGLAPFNDARDVIPNFRQYAPAWSRRLVTNVALTKAIKKAERKGGFLFDDTVLSGRLTNYATPTLLLHGQHDELVPWQQSEAIKDASSSVTLVLVDENVPHHVFPAMLPQRCREVLGWLEATLSQSGLLAACERIAVNDTHKLLDAIMDARMPDAESPSLSLNP